MNHLIDSVVFDPMAMKRVITIIFAVLTQQRRVDGMGWPQRPASSGVFNCVERSDSSDLFGSSSLVHSESH